MSGEVVAERFEVERLAGQGGMGTVYRALDRTTKGSVALKIVEGAHANARFAREAQVLAVLDHPSIVRYVAHGPLPQGRMYLAMEWLEGLPLDARLDDGAPFSLVEALAIGRTLAGALGAAHALGVVHRDVKPSNVLLRGGEASRAVLLDFGIARASKATVAMTKTGAVIGTPAYMAPEQARGDKGVDARADVFSLGCVLFECLCGRPAFVGEHVVAVLAKILLEPAPRLSSLRPDLPRALDDLVARMLAKDPGDRPANGDAVARALEVLDVASTSRGEPSLVPRSVAIGSTERRFATVLLASPPAQKAIEHADTEDALVGVTQEAVVFDVGSTQGVTITPLANGMFVGAVVAEEGARDAAERVARCALVLAERAPDVTSAIASGRAIVVADQVPVGDVIDRAARLLALRRGERAVIVDEPTRSIVEGAFVVTGEGDSFTIVREREASERVRTVLGRVVPFVGRDRELALLEASFRECVEEPVARASLVVAQPGNGKSRLAREVVRRILDDHTLDTRPAIWTALAQPATQRTPFGLASDLFRRALGIAEGEPAARRRETIAARVHDVITGPAAATIARFLAELVGASDGAVDDDPAMRAARRAPDLMRARIEETVITFAMAELAKRPLLVVAEDIHWADPASVNLLGLLLARAKELPLMVLALARPSVDEVHPNVWRDVRCERIVLAPLLKKASEKIARAVLGDHPEIEAIVRRAEGNALFVEELARACAEGRAASDVPPTVVAATEARLAAMDPQLRQILRAGAVFGERFWLGGVTHLLGGAPFVAERLERLERLELVSHAPESRFAGERELVFRHALVRDAAYAMFTDEDRTLGHALAGEWLADRVEDAALLAYHFENGGRAKEAAHHHVEAADQALLAQDVDAVHRHAGRAEALGATPRELAMARAAQADASLYVGAHPAAAEQSRFAMAGLEQASARWFEALAVGLVSSGKLGDRALFESFVTELEKTSARDPEAGRARAVARARAAIQLAYFNEIPRADELLAGCEAEPGAAGDIGVKAWVLAATCERGTAAGEPVHPSVPREARLLCESIGDTRGAFGHWGSELQLFATIGAFTEALDCGRQMLAASGGRARSIVLYARSNDVMLAAIRGEFEPLFAFIDDLRASASPRLFEYFTATCAQVLFMHGRLEEAERYAREVIRSLALVENVVGPVVTSRAVLARIAAKRGQATEAMDHVAKIGQQAIAPTVVASATAMIFLARIEALEAAGRAAEARAALTEGVAHMERSSRNLGEYRAVFYRSFEGPELFARARAAGLPVPEGA